MSVSFLKIFGHHKVCIILCKITSEYHSLNEQTINASHVSIMSCTCSQYLKNQIKTISCVAFRKLAVSPRNQRSARYLFPRNICKTLHVHEKTNVKVSVQKKN